MVGSQQGGGQNNSITNGKSHGKSHQMNTKQFILESNQNVGHVHPTPRPQVVAVADSRSAIFNERGLDIPALLRHQAEGRLLSDFDNVRV